MKNNKRTLPKQWLTIVLQTHKGGWAEDICRKMLFTKKIIVITPQQTCVIDSIVKSQFTIAQLNNQANSIQLLREGYGVTPSLLLSSSDSHHFRSLKNGNRQIINEYFPNGLPDDLKHFNNLFSKCAFMISSDFLLGKELIPAHRGGEREERDIYQMQLDIHKIIHVELDKIKKVEPDKMYNTQTLFKLNQKREIIIAYRELMYLLQAIQAYQNSRLPVNITIGMQHRKSILYLAKECFGIYPAVINTVSLDEDCKPPIEPFALGPPPCSELKKQFLTSFPNYSQDLWSDPLAIATLSEHTTVVPIMGLFITLMLIMASMLSSCYRVRSKEKIINVKLSNNR